MFQGVTTYFSSNCTLQDANRVTQLHTHKSMEAYNSRVIETVEKGIPTYDACLLTCVQQEQMLYRRAHTVITVQDCCWKFVDHNVVS
jgi:hypothetical protein